MVTGTVMILDIVSLLRSYPICFNETHVKKPLRLVCCYQRHLDLWNQFIVISPRISIIYLVGLALLPQVTNSPNINLLTVHRYFRQSHHLSSDLLIWTLCNCKEHSNSFEAGTPVPQVFWEWLQMCNAAERSLNKMLNFAGDKQHIMKCFRMVRIFYLRYQASQVIGFAEPKKVTHHRVKLKDSIESQQSTKASEQV